MPKVIFVLLCLLFPLSALAHSPLSNVSPEDGAKLEDAPMEISMVFKSPAKLIKLVLLKKRRAQRNHCSLVFLAMTVAKLFHYQTPS